MSLYPTLEDMTVDQYAQAQNQAVNVINQQQQQLPGYQQQQSGYPQLQQQFNSQQYPSQQQHPPQDSDHSLLYPQLTEYMGLNITADMLANSQVAIPARNQIAQVSSNMVAPITGLDNVGVMRSEIKQGIRTVVLCKDSKGRIGLKVQAVNKGIFICFVESGSPASLAGLRFGDQIIQINGQLMAGYDTSKALNFLRKALPAKITMAIRDRPFDRSITMHKDSAGCVGFVFSSNKITAIAKDSSAARNGLLTEHNMVEVNGQNVIGLKEKEIKAIFENAESTLTITIIPSFVYEHMIKNMGGSLVKKMDHSIPDV